MSISRSVSSFLDCERKTGQPTKVTRHVFCVRIKNVSWRNCLVFLEPLPCLQQICFVFLWCSQSMPSLRHTLLSWSSFPTNSNLVQTLHASNLEPLALGRLTFSILFYIPKRLKCYNLKQTANFCHTSSYHTNPLANVISQPYSFFWLMRRGISIHLSPPISHPSLCCLWIPR